MISKVLSKFKRHFFILVLVSLFSACYYDNVQELHPTEGLFQSCDTTGTISYANDIVPIMNSNCGTTNSCHSANNTSGYNLSTYSGLSDQAMGGSLVMAITHDPSLTPAQWMPSGCGGCFLNKCSMDKIIAWVNRGYLEN